MPIYVYKKENGEILEIKQSIHEHALEFDPDTGEKMHRVIQSVIAQYKGSGFYHTDNPRLVKEVWTERAASKYKNKTKTETQ